MVPVPGIGTSLEPLQLYAVLNMVILWFNNCAIDCFPMVMVFQWVRRRKGIHCDIVVHSTRHHLRNSYFGPGSNYHVILLVGCVLHYFSVINMFFK